MDGSVPTGSRSWRLKRLDRSGKLPMGIVLGLVLIGCTRAQQASLSPQPSLRVADAALAAGAPELALRVADLALERNARNPQALVSRGDALYAMGQREGAREAYRQAVAIEPTLASAQLGLGRTLAQADPAAAEKAFQAAISAQPDNGAALNDLGISLDMQGRHADAQEAYRRSLGVTPGAADVKINLGLSLALSGEGRAAVGILHEAAAVPDGIQGRQKELAAALVLAGDETGAQRILRGDSQQLAPDIAVTAISPAGAAQMAVRARPARSVATLASTARPTAPAQTDFAQTDAQPVPPATISTPVIAAADANPGSRPHVIPEALVGTAVLPATQSAAEPAAKDHFAKRESAKPTPYVQLASLHSFQGAQNEWRRLSRRLSQLLGGHTPVVVKSDARGQTYWLLRTFGFADLAGATAMCSEAQETLALSCWARETS